MLTNPTVDTLRHLGLSGKGSCNRKQEAFSMANGLQSCSNASRPRAARSASRREPARPGSVMTHRSRMSISVQHAVSTVTSSLSFPPATGSDSGTPCY